MNAFKRLMGGVSRREAPARGDGYFAVVVSLAPLMVRIETDPDQEEHRAVNLVEGLSVGDRVFVAPFGNRLVALGKPVSGGG